jgi:hypothetical protein
MVRGDSQMTDRPPSITDSLVDGVLDLQRQQDESALNEIALIMTLKELLPGFSQRFDQVRNDVKSMIAGHDEAFFASLRDAVKKRVN